MIQVFFFLVTSLTNIIKNNITVSFILSVRTILAIPVAYIDFPQFRIVISYIIIISTTELWSFHLFS